MGGAWNLNPGMYDWINCHLDFCEAQTGKKFLGSTGECRADIG